MQILDGKILQKNILNEIKKTVSLLEISPKLVVISIENDPNKEMYIKEIEKMCKMVGYSFELKFFEAITEETLLAYIEKLNQDGNVHSILLLAPLPFYLDEEKIRNHILKEKDIEGLGVQNQIERAFLNNGYCPCTAFGIISFLEFHNIDIKEKNVVILNRGIRIGKPLFSYFLENDCTVTVLHSKSSDIEVFLKNADIVITAIGKGPFLEGKLFKKDSVVIDVGMFEQNGKIVGDVIGKEENLDFYYGSHTGGIGPATVASLAKNILTSYYLLQEDK